ncbi:hypothetical protein OG381_45695 [Streptomyces sp. NBC_00490]|uniref:hypothetical protein n=1 Tax=Streptomyces sp. NBC_00490 TaxID=2903657 RepID=UPI002E17D781
MTIPRERNGRPLTLYTLDLQAALKYAHEALAEGLNVEITDRDLRDTLTYRTFQDSPILTKYWCVSLRDDASAMGHRSASAHQIIEAVEALQPEEYGAIHADDLVEFCKAYSVKTRGLLTSVTDTNRGVHHRTGSNVGGRQPRREAS